jgi:hypothetical protein
MLPVRTQERVRAVRRDQDHLLVDAPPGGILGVPGLAQQIDPDACRRHQRGVEIEEGVARRGPRIADLVAGAHGNLVAKRGVVEMQMRERAARFELRPVGGRKAIDVEHCAGVGRAENSAAARDNAAAAHNRIAHQHRTRRGAGNGIDLDGLARSGCQTLRETSRPEDRGRQLADDIDAIVEVMSLVVIDKAMKQLILDAEDADRLGVVDEPRRGDVAGQIDADQKDQRTVGETFRLRHVPGREQITDEAAALRRGDRRRRPFDLADLVGAGEDRLQNLRRQVLGDSRTGLWFVSQRPRHRGHGPRRSRQNQTPQGGFDRLCRHFGRFSVSSQSVTQVQREHLAR